MLKQKVEKANESMLPLKWIRYQIPPGFTIKNSEFKVNVYLNSANFLGLVSFYKSTFERNASFAEATFNGEAKFSGAKFNEEAYFHTTFEQQVNFSEATFNGEVYFIDNAIKGIIKLKTNIVS